MGSHNIYLINKFSTASQYQDYAFFGGIPRLSHNPSCSSIYSNVIKSTSLGRAQTWSLGIGSAVYAWTGRADRKLDTIARVDVTSSKLAVLGTDNAPSSSFTIRNQDGGPAFDQRAAMVAESGTVAFETGNDFDSNSHFVFGLATPDDEGKLKSTFTMIAATNATVNVTPSSKLYIAAHTSSTGSAIDVTQVDKHAALLDFTGKPVCTGAVVVHEMDGTFSVHYSSAAEFDAIVERESFVAPEIVLPQPQMLSSDGTDSRDAEIIQLKEQIKIMEFLVSTLRKGPTLSAPVTPRPSTPAAMDAPDPFLNPSPVARAVSNINALSNASADPYPTKPQTAWYKAVMPFQNNPGQSRRRDIRERLSSYMQTIGYTYEGSTLDDNFVAIFSHNAGSYGNWHSVHKATQDFRNIYEALPRHLKGYLGSPEDFEVTRTTESRGLWRARGETESRVVTEPPVVMTSNGLFSSQANATVSEHRVSAQSQDSVAETPKAVRHERTPSKKAAKRLNNGIAHNENMVNGNGPIKNGINGVYTPTKAKINGQLPNGQTPNGVQAVGIGNKKYDYKKGPDTPMEAAKRRAREVLRSQGLDEYSIGWGLNNSY